jgi:cytochrome c oxidase assembly protein subunit 15
LSRRFVLAALGLLLTQIALGGWVSTNYAVLACRGFPACNGQWWPVMDAAHGFTLLRELGRAGHGGYLPFEALVAIHMAHRLFALIAAAGLLALVLRLRQQSGVVPRRYALLLAVLIVGQVATGLSNVVLDWPIAAALAHSGGAAALVGVLTSLLARLRPEPRPAAIAAPLPA